MDDQSTILEITLNQKIKATQDDLRQELDDHRDSINENTNEIQANYQYLNELNAKIEKLQEKLHSIQLFVTSGKAPREQEEFGHIEPLTAQEKKVFLILYTQEKGLLYSELAARLSMPQDLLLQYITSIIEKGVPLIKEYLRGSPRIRLSEAFKEQQAKHNLIGLTEHTLVSFTGA